MKYPAVARETLDERISRRRPGDSPYPLKLPSNDDISFDIWDHLSLRCQMHYLDVPPPIVLDLGCGSGYWAVQAAKEWPTTIVIGFDMLLIQPDLNKFDMHADIAHRVRWVHGNFLDGLPFLPDYFEFVHISRIGLGVPEDEWQPLLEEVARVMKPGGFLEVIEEDPIFPCAITPGRGNHLSTSLRNSARSSPIGSDRISEKNTSSRLLKHGYVPKALSSIAKCFHLGSYRKTTLVNAGLAQCYRSSDSLTNQTAPLQASSIAEVFSKEPTLHQNNLEHARLKLAWEALLANRFLPLNLLSVLPFYLSTSFVRVQTQPRLIIPLPQNSDLSKSFHQSAHPNLKSLAKDTPSSPNPLPGAIHLAKSVNTIKSCKEAIWKEYVALFIAESVNRNVRSMREFFEADWKNWTNDMEDRIGMRRCLRSEACWPEPPGDKPEWRSWREELDTRWILDAESSTDTLDEPVCRSARTFVAWKARALPS